MNPICQEKQEFVNKKLAKHQYFDTTYEKFDKYYSILILSDPDYKNNRLKSIRVLYFDVFWQEFCFIKIQRLPLLRVHLNPRSSSTFIIL